MMFITILIRSCLWPCVAVSTSLLFFGCFTDANQSYTVSQPDDRCYAWGSVMSPEASIILSLLPMIGAARFFIRPKFLPSLLLFRSHTDT